MKTSRSLCCLPVLLSLIFGTVGANAQTMKIVTRTSTQSGAQKVPTNSNLDITCQSNGTAGLEFLLATASGGTAPYKLSVSSLPAEAGTRTSKSSLFATVLLGDAGKSDQFKVAVTDKTNKTVTESCSIAIASPPVPGAMSLGCPGTAYVGTAFQIVNVSGGTPPYTYTAALPKQLTLDPSTGLVTGASTPGILPNQKITVSDKSGNPDQSIACTITVLPQPASLSCVLFPVGSQNCVGSGVAKNANINAFWQTNGSFVFFNQINSIYNGASNSETVSADIGTLNFPFGMQLNIGSNIQAGSVPPTAVSAGTVPTLSPSAAAQAAQNMLYGGTITASGAYPILAVGGNRINNPGSWGGMLDFAARQGVDVQNFKSGTSTGLTSPSTHTSFQVEGYVQVNSTNLPTVGGGTFAGALFAGGSYGYSYASHEYIRDYGIASPNNHLGQVSAGIILNGVAKVAFSRAFGPSQTYFNGSVTPTPSTPTTVNNFKTLSFELSYQSAAPGSK